MPIIIEGPDGAGKSTLAADLADACGLNIIKMTLNGGQSADEYTQKLSCKGIVMDRCWISEEIYAEFFGREQRLPHSECELLNEVCAELDIPIVMVLPPRYVVMSRLYSRGDEHSEVMKNIDDIYDKYKEYAKAHDQIIVVDDSKVDQVLKGVAKWLL